jgi:hypothetical protein
MAPSGTARDVDEAAQRFVVMAIFTLASVIGAFNRTKLNGRAIRRRTVRCKLGVTGPDDWFRKDSTHLQALGCNPRPELQTMSRRAEG